MKQRYYLFLILLVCFSCFYELKAQTYCTPSYTGAGFNNTGNPTSFYTHILEVSLADIQNTVAAPTTNPVTNYKNFTAISTDLVRGGSYPVTIKLGNGANPQTLAVWIDWNSNQVFESSERLFTQFDNANVGNHEVNKTITVPLARYVAMNRNTLVFPFKRYHIDKVWRADRPQKGRYREFYQCDADVIGSNSLLYDSECILMFDDVLTQLNIPPFEIKINNRKLLSGIAEEWDFADKFTSFTIAIDKWDKIGEEGVIRELGGRGFTETQIHKMQMFFRLKGSNEEKLQQISSWFQKSETGKKGIAELQEVLGYLKQTPLQKAEIALDFTLARGLDYYTSTIFEVKIKDYPMGSIASGGRYDELTATFGLPDMPGVGISFGAERIYDVMLDLNLLPEQETSTVKVLVINFGGEEEQFAFGILQKLRASGIGAEMYPSAAKMGKQFQYAEKKFIPFVLIAGSEEIKAETYKLKNLASGEQMSISWEELKGGLSKEKFEI